MQTPNPLTPRSQKCEDLAIFKESLKYRRLLVPRTNRGAFTNAHHHGTNTFRQGGGDYEGSYEEMRRLYAPKYAESKYGPLRCADGKTPEFVYTVRHAFEAPLLIGFANGFSPRLDRSNGPTGDLPPFDWAGWSMKPEESGPNKKLRGVRRSQLGKSLSVNYLDSPRSVKCLQLVNVWREEERDILMEQTQDAPPNFKWSAGRAGEEDTDLPVYERLFKVSKYYAKRQNAVRWEIMRRRIAEEEKQLVTADKKSRFRRDGNGLTKEELDAVIEKHYQQAEEQKKKREEAAKAKADEEVARLQKAREKMFKYEGRQYPKNEEGSVLERLYDRDLEKFKERRKQAFKGEAEEYERMKKRFKNQAKKFASNHDADFFTKLYESQTAVRQAYLNSTAQEVEERQRQMAVDKERKENAGDGKRIQHITQLQADLDAKERKLRQLEREKETVEQQVSSLQAEMAGT